MDRIYQSAGSQKKLRALLVADRPNWVYDRKAHNLAKRFSHFQVEVGYVVPGNQRPHWLSLQAKMHFDAIWLMGYRMGRDNINRDPDCLAEFVRTKNRIGTSVVGSVTNSLIHFPVPSHSEIQGNNGEAPPISFHEKKLLRLNFESSSPDEKSRQVGHDTKRMSAFNSISANNTYAFHKLSAIGIRCGYVPDGTDLHMFQSKTPVLDRAFGILFISSQSKQNHKGIDLFRTLSKTLEPLGIRCRAVIPDSRNNWRTPADMCRIYNSYPIFICASKAEGGPATLLESAACGCVPISTPVGYATHIIGEHNGFIVQRKMEAFREKVQFLRDNPAMLKQMSEGVQKSVSPWDWSIRANKYENFLLESLR